MRYGRRIIHRDHIDFDANGVGKRAVARTYDEERVFRSFRGIPWTPPEDESIASQ